MNRVISAFGRAVERLSVRQPGAARALLSAGFAETALQSRLPFPGTSPAGRCLSGLCAQAVLRPFLHPERSVLVSVFTPCEQLHALGLIPMFPEGIACYLSGVGAENYFLRLAERSGVPETLCSYHKTLLGLARAGVLPKPLCIVHTTLACDANNLTFRELARFYQVPRFVLDVPYDGEVGALENQLRGLGSFLEEQTGERLEEGRLGETVARARHSLENFQRARLQGPRGNADPSREMQKIYALHVLLGTPQAERYTELLLAEPPAGNSRKIRLLWLHTLPHWQEPVGRLLADRCQIVACDMTCDWRSPKEEDPVRWMAARLAGNSFNGDAGRRIAGACSLARELDADGAVCFCTWGCRQTAGMARLAKEALEAQGVPTLVLDGDSCDRSNGGGERMLTRLEAFLEQLEGKRGGEVQ